ncbi:MAG: SDR family oxidoreductase [Cyclobacteriaceae bacterium]|nr:SDR family oxidoreductase [Cyclobacteriaceae bacterium]MCH8517098.1 SDR family oxidoreductase [Cyclobacteriaceae bacterium]
MSKNKTIVVTGASKGIGKAIVKLFAKNNWEIIACSRGEEALNKLKKEISEESPNSLIHTFPVDVSKKSEVLSFAERVKNIAPQLDVLVNNAGVFIPGEVMQEEDGKLEMMMETNLYSAYHLSRALAPLMQKKKEGYIFNICSIASFMAYPNGGSYSITKFAMLGMSKVLREELKKDQIGVSAVMPGATYTASWEGVDIPEARFMKSEDVANAIYYAYQAYPSTVMEEIVLRPLAGDL